MTFVSNAAPTITRLRSRRCIRAGRTRRGIARWVLASLLGSLLLAISIGVDYLRPSIGMEGATYVGRQSCVQCHRDQANAFAQSHHDLAMDLATEETVLADFNDVQFEHHGLKNRLFRDGKRFMVHTEGEDGTMQDFEIKYVFGVTPLQQYMVEFDRDENTPEDAIARLQVLRISWDTIGKKWFYLNPPDVSDKLDPQDDLHWTGIAQRWNTMCADCHSTNLQRNYHPDRQRYHTTFSEIDVSCESCHGPGSQHVQLAERTSFFWDRQVGYGLPSLAGPGNEAEIQSCAPCHSRRGNVAEGFQVGDAFCDFYDPSTLRSDLYHDDGQILDEVYEFGSFTQSKMYHKGIRCSDCHDPHSQQLKATGNQVCTSCHQHPAGKYDTPSHHKHTPGQSGSACVDCHMPTTTYMELDRRRDHSLRIPRPDLSVSLGTPNACTGCHLNPQGVSAEKAAELKEYADWYRVAKAGDAEVLAEIQRADRWCDDACNRWYGDQRRRDPHFASDIHAFRQNQAKGSSEGAESLWRLSISGLQTPAIARATALDELSLIDDPEDRIGLTHRVRAGRESLADPDPVVRSAAIRAVSAEVGAAEGSVKLAGHLSPLLDDQSRLVRSNAARTLATSGAYSALDIARTRRFNEVLVEIREGLRTLSDRSGAHMDWALICESTGQVAAAIEAYQTAIRVEPKTVGPRSNLASLLENLLNSQQSTGELSEQQITERRKQIVALRAEELPLLARDAELLPTSGRLQYRLGLAYYLSGDLPSAEAHLQRAVELETNQKEFAEALRLLREQMTNGG